MSTTMLPLRSSASDPRRWTPLRHRLGHTYPAGLTAVLAGALAATAKKRPGRHPRAGHIYLWALGGIFTTAAIMADIRWREDAHLFAIAIIAFGLGLYGYRARRRHSPGWPPHHAIGMGGSYIALLTGFYVDNGPFLPLWNSYPTPPTGSCPASSAYRSSGAHSTASGEFPPPLNLPTTRLRIISRCQAPAPSNSCRTARSTGIPHT